MGGFTPHPRLFRITVQTVVYYLTKQMLAKKRDNCEKVIKTHSKEFLRRVGVFVDNDKKVRCLVAEDVNSMGVRLRLYGCERMRRERMIGETVISFSCINLELESNMWLPLEPRVNITVRFWTSEQLVGLHTG